MNPHPGYICDDTCAHGGLRIVAPLAPCPVCGGQVERGPAYSQVTCFHCGFEGEAVVRTLPDAKSVDNGPQIR